MCKCLQIFKYECTNLSLPSGSVILAPFMSVEYVQVKLTIMLNDCMLLSRNKWVSEWIYTL